MGTIKKLGMIQCDSSDRPLDPVTVLKAYPSLSPAKPQLAGPGGFLLQSEPPAPAALMQEQ